MGLDPASFEIVRRIVRERAAIVLEEGKEYLVEARLKPILGRRGYDSYEALAARLGKDAALTTDVVEALTTNETSFFRDVHPFDVMRDTVLPDLIERRARERSLNIWCAASSTGQEPLSLGILLREHFPELSSWNVRILATDINETILERCRSGEYSQLEVSRGLPARLLVKYFDKSGARWKVRDEVLGLIEYRQLNLAQPFPPMPEMDVVFLRNVLIYFDVQTKSRILNGVNRLLRPDGTLFLGTAESLVGLGHDFRMRSLDRGSCYQRAA